MEFWVGGETVTEGDAEGWRLMMAFEMIVRKMDVDSE